MTDVDLETLLARTIDDHRLSRGEKSALRDVFGDLLRGESDRRRVRKVAFDLARQNLGSEDGRRLVDWLEAVVKLLDDESAATTGAGASVSFAPESDCTDRILAAIDGARATIDVCVFTLTDDRIAKALVRAHERGVRIRILTDDEKASDLGADPMDLAQAGLAVAYDRGGHMHHKFAIFDGHRLLNGSFNWTRAAARDNYENLVLTDDAGLARAFQAEFDRLWARYGR